MFEKQTLNPLVVLVIVLLAAAYVHSPIGDTIRGGGQPATSVDGMKLEYPVASGQDYQIELASSVTPEARGDWWGYGFDIPYRRYPGQVPRGCGDGCVFYPSPAYGDFGKGLGYTGYGPGLAGWDYPTYRAPIYNPPPGNALPEQALAMKWVGKYELRLSWVDPRLVQSIKYELLDLYGNPMGEAITNTPPYVAVFPVPVDVARVRATVTYTNGFSANVYPLPR